MEKRELDWRTIILLTASAGAALFSFAIASLMIIYAVFGLASANNAKDSPSPLEALVLGSALGFVGLTFIPSIYYSIQQLRGKDSSAASRPFKVWQGVLLFIAWIGAALLAQFLVNNETLQWFAPPLYLVAIVVPVYFFIRLSTGGLNPGSRQRMWGVLSTGMAAGVSFSIICEGALLVIGLIVFSIYLAFHPDQLATFRQLADQLSTTTTPDEALALAGSWLVHPLTLIIALFFFSVATPLIEETAKSLAIWSVFDRLVSPAQGFVIGALSGAGFALLESLLASATPDPGWASTLLVRGGSTMMHILAAGLTGWGIASLRVHKSYGRMFGMYALAMSLHGLWNGGDIIMVFGSARQALETTQLDVLGWLMIIVGAAFLIILSLTIPIVLGVMNWRFRVSTAPATAQPSVPEIAGNDSSTLGGN